MTDDASGTVGLRAGVPMEDRMKMGDEIAVLAGQLAAATARFLRLVGEFDDCAGWEVYWGLRSTSHWLSWKTGVDPRTAREHVRVARALRIMPHTAARFAEGRLSYSKVRAITRVCTPETEEDMASLAMGSTASQVERLAGGLRRAQLLSEDPELDDVMPRPRPDPEDRFGVSWRWDPTTGDLVIRGRVPADEGATVLAGLTRAELERIRTTADEEAARQADGGTRRSSPGDRHGQSDLTGPPPREIRPALEAMAQMCLAAVDAPANAPASEVVFPHGRADLAAGAVGGDLPAPGGSAGPPPTTSDGSAGPLTPDRGASRSCRLPTTTQGAGRAGGGGRDGLPGILRRGAADRRQGRTVGGAELRPTTTSCLCRPGQGLAPAGRRVPHPWVVARSS